MFRIGQTLRDVRESRGLELDDVEQATMIRRRYLAALEAEQFDVVPGKAYVRAFLREYAEFLGLDPAPFLEQIELELEEPEPVPFAPPPVRRRSPEGRWLLALGVLAGLATAGLLAWKFGGGKEAGVPLTVRAAPPKTPTKPAHRAPSHVSRPAAPAGPHLRLTAARGPVWLLVRRDGADGPTIFESTLQPGRSVSFGRRTLWIRIGAPWNLDVRLDGRPAGLPPTSRPANVLVPAHGRIEVS